MKTASKFAPGGAAELKARNGGGAPKWHQLRALEEAREPLGLKATSINVLRAMLSFMKADRVSDLAPDHHIVYASNAAIAQRAHVSVPTAERHIAKLVDLKIIQRTVAANGKRWCRRNRAGETTLVSGLSVLPLSSRHAEFVAIGSEFQRAQEALQVLRDECILALAKLHTHVSSAVQDLLDHARRILRRKPQRDALCSLLEEINAAIPVEDSCEDQDVTIKTTGSNTRNEGHKEHSLNQNSKKENLLKIQLTQDDMEYSFPKLCTELRFARSNEEGQRMMDDLAQQLQLSKTWWKCKEMGAGIAFVMLGYILERVDSVENHSSYLNSLISRIENQEIDIRHLLKRRTPGQ